MTPRQIIKSDISEICDRHNVSMADVISPSRLPALVAARYEVFWMLRTRYGLSYPRIGQIMRRDHSTVVYGIRRHLERTGQGGPVAKRQWMRDYYRRTRDVEAA